MTNNTGLTTSAVGMRSDTRARYRYTALMPPEAYKRGRPPRERARKRQARADLVDGLGRYLAGMRKRQQPAVWAEAVTAVNLRHHDRASSTESERLHGEYQMQAALTAGGIVTIDGLRAWTLWAARLGEPGGTRAPDGSEGRINTRWGAL